MLNFGKVVARHDRSSDIARLLILIIFIILMLFLVEALLINVLFRNRRAVEELVLIST